MPAREAGASRGIAPAFAIEVRIGDPEAAAFAFRNRKTMYGGRTIGVGAVVYLFDSETRGGRGLPARSLVTAAGAVPRAPGPRRQTSRVSVAVERRATVRVRLGRAELKPFSQWDDGRPETELNFKLYRQATDKVVGLTPSASALLEGCL